MFRQVVCQTWAAGVTEDQKQGFLDALSALGAIPEVASIRIGADAGVFPGNYDVVSVLDFADVGSARRYVEHPSHQAFLVTWSQPLTDQRVIVQHQWGAGTVAGMHHLKLPVTDVARSRLWYMEALGFEPDLEFVEDGVLRGVALTHAAGSVRLALRHDPARAACVAGFDLVALAVGTRADLAAVLETARAAGARTGDVVSGREGWACDLVDPDGIVVRLYTYERHP
jgi:catechol 2,3-dioxygenase-like lactoylglutathione lyase family enzyme